MRTVTWVHIVPLILSIQLTVQENHSSTLILTHVVFRHGARTPEPHELYPKDPYLNYTYFPFGRGQVTDHGKRFQYALGKFLRSRYDDFLGPYYYPDIVESYTTSYDRTKTSVLLVLAGLFPIGETENWNANLAWTPIPYNYIPLHHDQLLLGILQPNYVAKYDEYTASEKVQREYHEHRHLFDYISEHSGRKVTNFFDVFSLYWGLRIEDEWGFTLPQWTEKVWPHAMAKVAIKQYNLFLATRDMTKIVCGHLMKKIIKDTQKKINKGYEKYGRKMYLYSAHETNVACLLVVWNIAVDHIPTYGSYIIVEVHEINKTHAVKLLHQNYETENPVVLKLPLCDEFCPFQKFVSLVDEFISDIESKAIRTTTLLFCFLPLLVLLQIL